MLKIHYMYSMYSFLNYQNKKRESHCPILDHLVYLLSASSSVAGSVALYTWDIATSRLSSMMCLLDSVPEGLTESTFSCLFHHSSKSQTVSNLCKIKNNKSSVSLNTCTCACSWRTQNFSFCRRNCRRNKLEFCCSRKE